MLLENGISFVREGGSYDFFDTGSTRSFGEQSRVNAVAGNDSQVAWNINRVACHSERTEAESKNPAKLLQSHATGFLDFARNDAGALAVVAATFDLQLGKRFLQRSLDGSNFFGSVILFHSRFGALYCGLGRSDIDFL